MIIPFICIAAFDTLVLVLSTPSSHSKESSDEDEPAAAQSDDDSDTGGVVTLGRDITQPIPVPDDNAEVDLDEDNYADLDAQAAAYAEANPEADQDSPEIQPTRRIAVVNLDWEHVRAIHLYKVFSSLLSPTGAPVASSSKGKGSAKASAATIARGKVLSVRVYPSEFGKERMAREEKEGPPPEVFKKRRELAAEEINERTVYEVGDGEDYDEDALRKYQLERLRYVSFSWRGAAPYSLPVDISTLSSNVIPLKQRHTSSVS